MSRKTKYCLNFRITKHLNDNGAHSQYCTKCFEAAKERYKIIDSQGGPIQGLRAARIFDGGFGYEKTKSDKHRNLMAFFYYVMPHIPLEEARKLSDEMSKTLTSTLSYH